jgi:mannose-6-phosphate isomerase-like protein (cupin superfamily)
VFYSAPPPPARLHQEYHDLGRGAVDRVGPDEIARALSGVSPTADGVVFPDSRDQHAQYVANRRTAPSAVEQHNEWDDILIVQAGRGEIRHGGPWRDARNRYQGERRGGSLEDPVTVQIGPGDVVRIPAGEPHRILPVGDDPLSYLVVKVRINRQP